MGSKICMNEGCPVKSSAEWKKGWTLKSGESAILCYNCGYYYENFMFCETFHRGETGWRECRLCGKIIHCGCIASKFLHQCLDFGGVACTTCLKQLDSNSIKSLLQAPICEIPPLIPKYEKTNLLQTPDSMDLKESVSYFPQLSSGLSMFIKPPDHNRHDENNNPLNTSGSNLPFFNNVEGTIKNKASSLEQEQKSNHISPKPTESGSNSSLGPELNKNTETQSRVPRPPADGKGRTTQLLPRYWPRITDQELHQLSRELKSSVVPLFEKILSASDAGRIGRLVLPKACAEAYFPTINQSDGLPIQVQDVKGKEWTFQFRFWPNNNSRMYVLEGITPCMQNLQLEAGDTVTFSRMDPCGKLVIGVRKATKYAIFQDPLVNDVSSGEAQFPSVDDNMVKVSEDSSLQHILKQEKNKVRNIGSKNKRLFMDSDDAMELRLSWEEAQYLLRPPSTSNPTIFIIEDYEFEEYDEPPIFGKKSVFTTDHPSGDQAQWAQCDSCKKWRKLPVNILLPARWTCSDNIWDADRCSCLAPDETIPLELDTFNKTSSRDSKRQRGAENKMSEDLDDNKTPSGLDALANAAVLGDKKLIIDNSLAEQSGGGTTTTTTKHPRHRAGCTCIVCIQPPSGSKGKHPLTCKCNVCNNNNNNTVKRRFKKTKQSEGDEAEQDRNMLFKINDHHSEGDNLMEIPEFSKGRLDLNSKPRHEHDDEHPGIGFACFKQNGFEKLK